MLIALVFAAPRKSIAAPTVARPQSNAPVTVKTDPTDADYWILDNGIVKAEINKYNGNMVSLLYHGIETMAGGGYWEQTPQGSAKLTDTITIDPKSNGGERGEVAVKGVTGGQRFDMEVRYSLARGVSGIYAYAIFSHPASYGTMGAGESRYITKLNHDFNWISVDKDRNMLECTPLDWGSGFEIHAKEQRILNTGVYKNSVEHKYSYNAVQYKIPAYGWSSTKDKIGVYFINPTTEYLSGGASKLELVCHFDANDNPDPIILDYWTAGHYAGGASCNVAAGENWNKVVGPIFVYCNSLATPETASPADLETLKATSGNPTVPPAWTNNATALFDDALSQAKTEKAQWPYDWVNGIDYPHKDQRGNVTGQLVLNDPQAATTKLPHLTVGLAHPDYPRPARGGGGGGGGGRGGRGGFGRGGAATQPTGATAAASTTAPSGALAGRAGRGGGGFALRDGNSGLVTWPHDGNYYQFWNDGSDDGKFTITDVRPGNYTLHAFADGVLGEFAQADITVEAGKTLDLGKIEWTPVRYGKQIWEIGYPDRTAGKFFKADPQNYWLWGWCVRYGDLFPNDITYTVGKSDYHKDWFFEQVPHELSEAWKNPAARDPLNQPFGWIRTPGPNEDMWRTVGRGRATTWTIKFNMDGASKGQAAFRLALAGADGGGGLQVAVNGHGIGTIRTIATNALRYNTDTGVWYQYTQTFDAALLKAGENQMQLTVPAGEVTSGVVYDYLRLELNENAKPDAPLPPG